MCYSKKKKVQSGITEALYRGERLDYLAWNWSSCLVKGEGFEIEGKGQFSGKMFSIERKGGKLSRVQLRSRSFSLEEKGAEY